MKLQGTAAIEYAESHDRLLSKYADPTEEAREDLTPREARKVAAEDPSLIWIEIDDRRFEIGTLEDGSFIADSIAQDPELTGFPTLFHAIQEMREVIRASTKMWGEAMRNGAIRDSVTGRIVWRQEDEQ